MAKLELCKMTPEHLRIREVLIGVARKRTKISYTELLNKANIRLDMSIPYDRGQLGHLLGEISWNEVAEGSPMLSSVAIRANGSIQGQGFFDLAERLYNRAFNNADQRMMFGMDEMTKTHDFWALKGKVTKQEDESETTQEQSVYAAVFDCVDQTGNMHLEDAAVCMTLADEVSKLKETELAKLPFHLNLLSTVADNRIKETAHSRLLWKLLQLPELMTRFLDFFLADELNTDEEYKVNYPDKDRMDISIEGKTDFIIIENKVNDAPEQCGQIYRYVQHALRRYRPQNIHVLYLNSKTHDMPSSYSLSKDGRGKEYIPEEVSVKVISYKDEIIDWLDDMYGCLPIDESYLRSSIFQYSDYLKEIFNVSKRHDDMNHKIENLIKGHLFTEGMTTVEKLNAISDMNDELEELKSQLERLKEKQEAVRFQEWFEALTSEYPLDEYDWGRDNETDIHLPFKYQGYDLKACLTIDDRLCWGVVCTNKSIPNKWNKELHKIVQNYLPKVQSTDWWPAWDYTSFENGLNRFKTLLDCVFEIEDSE